MLLRLPPRVLEILIRIHSMFSNQFSLELIRLRLKLIPRASLNCRLLKEGLVLIQRLFCWRKLILVEIKLSDWLNLYICSCKRPGSIAIRSLTTKTVNSKETMKYLKQDKIASNYATVNPFNTNKHLWLTKHFHLKVLIDKCWMNEW